MTDKMKTGKRGDTSAGGSDEPITLVDLVR